MLFVAFLAAASIFFWASRSWLRVWLTKKTLDELYGLLDWALWAVIVGVVVEEWALIWKGCKFIRLAWAGEYAAALTKIWKHKGELAESVGFIVLTIGLAGELALDPLIETRQKADQLRAEGSIAALGVEARTAEAKIASAKRDAATAQANAALATADAARANERGAGLEKQAAEFKLDAEKAKLEQERLKAFVAWRIIPKEKFDVIAFALSKGRGSVTLRYVAVDPEAVFLAVQISKIFDEANKLAGSPVWAVSADPHIYRGRVVLLLHIPDRGNDTSKVVAEAFLAAGVPFQADDVIEPGGVSIGIAGVSFGQSQTTTDALIVIGSKLPPT